MNGNFNQIFLHDNLGMLKRNYISVLLSMWMLANNLLTFSLPHWANLADESASTCSISYNTHMILLCFILNLHYQFLVVSCKIFNIICQNVFAGTGANVQIPPPLCHLIPLRVRQPRKIGVKSTNTKAHPIEIIIQFVSLLLLHFALYYLDSQLLHFLAQQKITLKWETWGQV